MSFWDDKRVVITGSEGLMGTPLKALLTAAGAEVNGFDILQGNDILDLSSLSRAFKDTDAVFHLAANSGVEQSRNDGYMAWKVNVGGTLCVLEAARQAGVGGVIAASSNHVYGIQPKGATDERAALNQLDTYSATKIAADVMVRSYAHNYGLLTAAVRNTNCFGPDDPHSDHIIPGTINAVLRGDRPVIKGTGTTQKSYLYVDDVAEAYADIAEWLLTGKQGGWAFNVSTKPVQVRSLVTQIAELMGREDLEPVVLGRESDQADEHLDWVLVHKETGWMPKHTLREGLIKTIVGFKSRELDRVPA
jgi:nucleoside-diphosphate-sugar epimerase